MGSPSVDLCEVPAAPHPDGRPANFDNPASLAPATMSVLSILIAWAVIFTPGRICANFRRLSLGDLFASFALIMAIAIFCLESQQTRVMRHMWDTPACYFDAKFAQGVYYPGILLNIGQFFAKASIFLLFSRIFTIQKIIRYAIYAGHVANFSIYGAGFAVATYFETPRAGESWMDTLDGRMSKPIHWWQAQSALAVVLDFYIFILPLRPLWKLNLPIRRRISVIAVFSLALIAVELNVAIIVSSAPGFARFTRNHISAFSSFVGTFFTTSGKTRASEAALAISNDDSAKSDQSRSAVSDEHHATGQTHPYYELDETWNTGIAKERKDEKIMGRGIVRTTLLDQQISTASMENPAKQETRITA